MLYLKLLEPDLFVFRWVKGGGGVGKGDIKIKNRIEVANSTKFLCLKR